MVASANVRFAKYEGLGNDFVVVEASALDVADLTPEIARAVCDRHRGVGSDGVLVVDRDGAGALSMDVVNADGSSSEMCGNGLRCVALFAASRGWIPSDGRAIVRTGAGPLAVRVVGGGEVEVDMGAPELRRAHVPMNGPGDTADVDVDVSARTLRVSACAFGNPHATTFDPLSADERAAFGPIVERHALFPARVNVGFASMRPEGTSLDLVVWERGVGFTQACGTGACAAAVAAVRTGRAPADRAILVHLPGGDLTLTVAPDLSGVSMCGPARHVYSGELDLHALVARAPSSSGAFRGTPA